MSPLGGGPVGRFSGAGVGGGRAPSLGVPDAVLSSLSPALGDTAGGGTLTATGTGFLNGDVIRIDGSNQSTTFVSSSSLTCTIPAHAAGTISVVIRRGASDSNALDFEYQVDTGFPEAYSITRTEIAGALLGGWDGQGYAVQADIQNGEAGDFSMGSVGGDATETLLKISDVEQAQYCAHLETGLPVFGVGIRQYNFDGSTYSGLTPSNVEWSDSFTPKPRVWLRLVDRFNSTCDWRTDDDYTGAKAWKTLWTSRLRHLHMTLDALQINHQWIATSPGGTEQEIAGGQSTSLGLFNQSDDDSRGFKPWSNGSGADFGDEEWYEFILFDGFWPADDLYQKAFWFRKISSGGVLQTPELVLRDATTDGGGNSWPGGVPVKWGIEQVGATGSCADVSSVTHGKNKNSAYNPGDVDWYWRGPWEALDADVLPDPYGLAGDSLYASLNL